MRERSVAALAIAAALIMGTTAASARFSSTTFTLPDFTSSVMNVGCALRPISPRL